MEYPKIRYYRYRYFMETSWGIVEVKWRYSFV